MLVKKPYCEPCLYVIDEVILDSLLCVSTDTETENFDPLTDYEW